MLNYLRPYFEVFWLLCLSSPCVRIIIFTLIIDQGGMRDKDREEGGKVERKRKMLVLLVKMVKNSLSENRLNNMDPFTFDSVYIR